MTTIYVVEMHELDEDGEPTSAPALDTICVADNISTCFEMIRRAALLLNQTQAGVAVDVMYQIQDVPLNEFVFERPQNYVSGAPDTHFRFIHAKVVDDTVQLSEEISTEKGMTIVPITE